MSANVTCRACGSVVDAELALVAMAQTLLFACPVCLHQEVWNAARRGALHDANQWTRASTR